MQARILSLIVALLASVPLWWGANAFLDSEVRRAEEAGVGMLAARSLADPNIVPPDGALTRVRETKSDKYHFLNKRRYEVFTASTARQGSVLLGSDPFDKGRADRHAIAQRSESVVVDRLQGGRIRATKADGLVSVEVEMVPRPLAGASDRTSLLLGWLLFIAVFVLGASFVFRPGTYRTFLGGFAVLSAVAAVAWNQLATLHISATSYLSALNGAAVSWPYRSSGLLFIYVGCCALLLIGTAALSGRRGDALVSSIQKDSGAYAAVSPAMTGLLLLVGLPFFFGVGLAFFRHQHGTYTFVGLQNFLSIILLEGRSFFEPGSLPYGLFITILWTGLNVLFHVAIGLLLALLLTNHAAKFSKYYRALLILPWAVPAYLTALIWKSMFDPDVGVINRLLGLEGMSWMHDPVTAFLANLLTNVWLGFPFMMVVCLGALTSIPKDLYEAADVDGATWWQQFVQITLPLLKPALLPAVILGSVWTFNRFEVIYLVSEGRPDGATDILVTEAYRWAFERGLAQGGAYGYAAAYSAIIFVVLLLYGWMTSRVARSAEEALR